MALAALAISVFGWVPSGSAQDLTCETFLGGLPGLVRVVAPPGLCDRVALAATDAQGVTARNRVSRPVSLPDGRAVGFVDLAGPLASLHLIVWTGWPAPPDALFLASAVRSQGRTYVPAINGSSSRMEVLVDGEILRTASGEANGLWARSPWASLIVGAQVTSLPTFGVALVSLLLTPEGRGTLARELASGSGLQALLQWRVLHDVLGPSGLQTLTSTGHVSCLRRRGRAFSEDELAQWPPFLTLLPLDWKNLETLAACE